MTTAVHIVDVTQVGVNCTSPHGGLLLADPAPHAAVRPRWACRRPRRASWRGRGYGSARPATRAQTHARPRCSVMPREAARPRRPQSGGFRTPPQSGEELMPAVGRPNIPVGKTEQRGGVCRLDQCPAGAVPAAKGGAGEGVGVPRRRGHHGDGHQGRGRAGVRPACGRHPRARADGAVTQPQAGDRRRSEGISHRDSPAASARCDTGCPHMTPDLHAHPVPPASSASATTRSAARPRSRPPRARLDPAGTRTAPEWGSTTNPARHRAPATRAGLTAPPRTSGSARGSYLPPASAAARRARPTSSTVSGDTGTQPPAPELIRVISLSGAAPSQRAARSSRRDPASSTRPASPPPTQMRAWVDMARVLTSYSGVPVSPETLSRRPLCDRRDPVTLHRALRSVHGVLAVCGTSAPAHPDTSSALCGGRPEPAMFQSTIAVGGDDLAADHWVLSSQARSSMPSEVTPLLDVTAAPAPWDG